MDFSEVEDIGGRRIVRGPDGKFEQVELDPETARVMGSKRKRGKAIDESANALLIQAGYPEPSEAPEHLNVLAQLAASQRTGAVGAMAAFLKLTRPQSEGASEAIKPMAGQRCPTCGRWYNLEMMFSEEAIKKLVDEILELKAKK